MLSLIMIHIRISSHNLLRRHWHLGVPCVIPKQFSPYIYIIWFLFEQYQPLSSKLIIANSENKLITFMYAGCGKEHLLFT
jgi:hypothetical protein